MSITTRQPIPTRHRRATPGITLAAAVLGFFIVTLDATIVNVALPTIRDDLGGGITGLQWVVDGYTLMFAALLLSAGALSDRIGARYAFGVGLAIFIAASAGCAFAPGLGVLVGARFVQGAGAAIMMPASMALIHHAYPDPARRARAVGLWAMGGAVAAAAGPVLGGLLSLASWRWIFLINIPVGAFAFILLARSLHTSRHDAPFDWIGQVTAIVAMGGLTYGAIDAGAAGFAAPQVITAFTVAVVALAAFIIAQSKVKHPMMPLDLFASRTFNVCVAIGFAFMIGFYGVPFLFSLYFQQIRDMSSLDAGLAFLPMMVISGAVTPFSARIVERTGPRAPILTGLALMAIGGLCLALLGPSTPTWVLATLLVPIGLTGPLVMPPTTAVLLNSVPTRRAGTASGVFNTGRQVSGALAVAVFGGLLVAPAGFQHGLTVSLLITAGAAIMTAAIAILLPVAGLGASRPTGASVSRYRWPNR